MVPLYCTLCTLFPAASMPAYNWFCIVFQPKPFSEDNPVIGVVAEKGTEPQLPPSPP